MIDSKKIVIKMMLMLTMVGKNALYSMTQAEIKRDSAVAANTKAAADRQMIKLKDSGLSKPVQNLAISYIPFDWRWLPAFKINETVLRGAGGIASLVKLDEYHIAVGFYGNIQIWDLRTNKVAATLGQDGLVKSLIKLDGHHIASTSHGDIKIWNFRTEEIVTNFQGHEKQVYSLIKLDDNSMASGSEDGTIKIWDLRTNKIKDTFKAHKDGVFSLMRLNDHRLASGSYGDIKIWDLAKPEKLIATLKGHQFSIFSLLKLDENRIAAGDLGGTIKVWDLRKKEAVATLGHGAAVRSLIKLDEHCIAAGYDDGTIKIWDLGKPEKPITTFAVSHLRQKSPVYSLIKLDEYRIVSGSSDGSIIIWEVDKEQLAKVYAGLQEPDVEHELPEATTTSVAASSSAPNVVFQSHAPVSNISVVSARAAGRGVKNRGGILRGDKE